MNPNRLTNIARSKKAVLTAALVSAFAVVILAGVVTSSPRVCGSCHQMKRFVTAHAESSHSQIHCYRCHGSGGVLGVVGRKTAEWGPMLVSSIGRKPLGGPSRPISSSRCVDCHGAALKSRTQSEGLRIEHSQCVRSPAQCVDCHGTTAHGKSQRWITVSVMEDCILCHDRADVSTECDTCHQGRRERERLAVGPWQVTHGVQWQSTHGQGRLEYCETCHPPDYCVRCHGTPLPHGSDFGRAHGSEANRRGAKCTSCHDDKVCADCHGVQMPHPTGYLKRHSADASSKNQDACDTCHLEADCDGCHVAHTHPGRTDGSLGTGPGGAIGVDSPGEVRR